ncbi:hypothetical protein OS493_010912 [Desmophyllum pertusum]|uniref:Uncharacterized protein n=1 Tax=Desmophyllum pertusum TaxID=174260 RepID=A0A9W9ZF56_9CNID|nr:hypothetical protein OS493_010912 [Desmophyllum pertusum]
MGATGNRANDQETQVDQLDTIITVEEESCQDASGRSSRGKVKRGKNYDINVSETRRRRRRGWFRRNKIAPADLSTAEEGRSGTNGRKHGAEPEIFENKPVEASNDHVILGFSETKDTFMQRQNGALALQSFATCARLNENFMRRTAWNPNEICDGSTSDNQTTASGPSFSTKMSNAWKGFKRGISRRGSRVTAEGEAGPSKEKAREKTNDSTDNNPKPRIQESRKYFRRKSKKGNSSKMPRNEPVGIQELGEDDSTFDRDLYMQINNLAVTHDSCQVASRDPFFAQEEIPSLSEVPIDYLAMNLGEEDCWKSTKGKSRLSSFFARFKRRRN